MYARDLPSYETLSQYTPRTISRVYSGEGLIIDEFAQERRLFTPAEEIPELVKHAFVSAEDQNFYTHPGFDVRGMVAALVEAVQSRGEEMRGASTITQQGMKNFLLAARARWRGGERADPRRADRAGDGQGGHPRALPQRDLPGRQLLRGNGRRRRPTSNKPSTTFRRRGAYLAALAQRPATFIRARSR
jgi:penicillin-binding protein 1A